MGEGESRMALTSEKSQSSYPLGFLCRVYFLILECFFFISSNHLKKSLWKLAEMTLFKGSHCNNFLHINQSTFSQCWWKIKMKRLKKQALIYLHKPLLMTTQFGRCPTKNRYLHVQPHTYYP